MTLDQDGDKDAKSEILKSMSCSILYRREDDHVFDNLYSSTEAERRSPTSGEDDVE